MVIFHSYVSLPEGNHKASLRCSILLSLGPSDFIRFPKPPRHAGNGRQARAPAAADDGFPARFFFFFGVALVASSQAEKSWSVGLGQQKDIRKLEFYVIRHEFSE